MDLDDILNTSMMDNTIEYKQILRELNNLDTVEFRDADDDELIQTTLKAEEEYSRKRESKQSSNEFAINRVIERASINGIMNVNKRKRKRKNSCSNENHKKRKPCTNTWMCNSCAKTFATKATLTRHTLLHSSRPRVKCDMCDKYFSRADNMTRHMRKNHLQSSTSQRNKSFSCRHCDFVFDTYETLFEHVQKEHPMNQTGGADINQHGQEEEEEEQQQQQGLQQQQQQQQQGLQQQQQQQQEQQQQENVEYGINREALGEGVRTRSIFPVNNEHYDLIQFFANRRATVNRILIRELSRQDRQRRGIKWYITCQVEFERVNDEGDTITTSPYFRSRTYVEASREAFSSSSVDEALHTVMKNFQNFNSESSSWVLRRVIRLIVHIVEYRPLYANSYISLPKELAKRYNLVNIRNTDDRCFLYCILCHLYPREDNPGDVSHYLPHIDKINTKGLTFPMSIQDITKFEDQNKNISVHVFGYENNELFPLRISKCIGRQHHVDLLYLKEQHNCHYVYIKDLDLLLSSMKTNQHRHYFCVRCLNGFTKRSSLEKHQEFCGTLECQKVTLPTPGENILQFKEYEKTQKVPFVIYIDLETVNEKISTCLPDGNKSSTTSITRMEPLSFAYKVVSLDPKYSKPVKVYTGPHVSKNLIKCLLEEKAEIDTILSQIVPINLTKKEEDVFLRADSCCICSNKYTVYDRIYNRPVRHHCHISGTFLGSAHNVCNINCKQSKFIPCVTHNLSGFDSYLILQALAEFPDLKIQCIPHTMEKYISFSIENLRFLDSYKHLTASLETLVGNLAQSGDEKFVYLKEHFPEHYHLFLRKGIYPYQYIDSCEKLNEKVLPPRECFYSSLSDEVVSEKDYNYALEIFHTLNMKSMKDFHETYQIVDTLQLADIVEEYRNMCMQKYQLDPLHYYSAPGLAWASCLKLSEVKLELFTDIEMWNFVQKSIRGGLSQISNSFCEANNEYLENYDPNKESCYLMYFDVNNLYGTIMHDEKLPVSDFSFLSQTEINSFDINSVSSDSEFGYMLEVSLEIPEDRMDLLDNFCPCPEKKHIEDEQLSSFSKNLWNTVHGYFENDQLKPPRPKVEKLVATLENKSNYVLHYRTLQLYLSLGLKVIEIHRILRFKQEAWMRPFIRMNTECRKEAKTEFEKQFFKILNCACFGKTIENTRKHIDVKLVNSKSKLLKLTSKTNFKSARIFDNELVGVEMNRTSVLLNKPIYSGACILDLSKRFMYNWYYNFVIAKWGPKVKLCMTDTDSALIAVYGIKDIYEEMRKDSDVFDFSNYPKDHPLYSERNKKELGKVKDECGGQVMKAFCGLRSKQYSYIVENKNEKRCKGISRIAVQKQLNHDDYCNSLLNNSVKYATMHNIRSSNHTLYCNRLVKKALVPFDDKRYQVSSTESYAFGHWRIKQTEINLK